VVIVAYAIAAATGLTITGGTISDDGVTRYHLFTESGTLTIA
jgi:hypothetical protein